MQCSYKGNDIDNDNVTDNDNTIDNDNVTDNVDVLALYGLGTCSNLDGLLWSAILDRH